MRDREKVDRADIKRQLVHCGRLLRTVEEYASDWRGHGGGPFRTTADVLLQTLLARSARTYEAIIGPLGRHGFGEHSAMLNRSLFEDMVDAHWVSLHPDLAVQRLREHHRYSNRLKLDVAHGFPEYFGSDLPDQDPPMDAAERQHLAGIFGV